MDRRTFLTAAALPFVCAREAFAQQGVTSDGASRHRDFTQALALLTGRRWAQLSSFVAALPPQSASKLISDLGDAAPLSTDIESLAQTPLGNTIVAGFHVEWAWRYRGSGVASTVTTAGFEGFNEHLNLAKTCVEHAIRADPNDGVAHAIGFTVHKGLSDRRALRLALPGYLMAERRPVDGLSAYANALSRKWLGSQEEAFGFAHDMYTLDLPASTALIPITHHTEWSAQVMASARSPEPPQPFEEYLTHPAVREDILRANDAYNSVGADPDLYATLFAVSNFSYALLAMNEIELAQPHLVAMGHHIGGPWTYLPDPAAAIQGIRHQLGIETL